MSQLTDEQRMIRDMVREFAAGELAPLASPVDAAARFPEESLAKLAGLELLGLGVPSEHGGAGADALGYALAVEELARVCGSTALVLVAHSSLAARPLSLLGDDLQRATFLAPLLRGEAVGAGVLGDTDAFEPTLFAAARRGDATVLNGTAFLVANGARAEWFVVAARDEGGEVEFGILPRDTSGLAVTPVQTLGLRGAAFATVRCTDVLLPAAQRLGSGAGGVVLADLVDGARLVVGALAVGLAQSALERTLRYSRERPQFGKPIAELAAVQEHVAAAAVEVEAARLVVHEACRRAEAGLPLHKHAAIAKLVASEVAVRAADRAVQVHGGYGYVAEYHVERTYRDACMCTMLFGTHEALRLRVASELSLEIDAGLALLQ